MPSGARYLGIVALSFVGVACAESYCQYGPKHGGQCYSTNEIEWQEAQLGREHPPEQAVVPAPGCVTLTSQGLVQQPLPGTSPPPPRASAPLPSAPQQPPAGILSMACLNQRVPAVGAVR